MAEDESRDRGEEQDGPGTEVRPAEDRPAEDVSKAVPASFRLLPVSFAFLGLLGLTGLVLMPHYRPDAALANLDWIDLQQRGFLALVQEFHVWASMALVLLVSLRLLGAILHRAERSGPRWRSILGWSGLVFAFAWTGHVLRRPAETAALAEIYAVHTAVLPLLLLGWIAWLRGRRADRKSED